MLLQQILFGMRSTTELTSCLLPDVTVVRLNKFHYFNLWHNSSGLQIRFYILPFCLKSHNLNNVCACFLLLCFFLL